MRNMSKLRNRRIYHGALYEGSSTYDNLVNGLKREGFIFNGFQTFHTVAFEAHLDYNDDFEIIFTDNCSRLIDHKVVLGPNYDHANCYHGKWFIVMLIEQMFLAPLSEHCVYVQAELIAHPARGLLSGDLYTESYTPSDAAGVVRAYSTTDT